MYDTSIKDITEAQNNSKQAMEKIITNNSGLVWSIVNRFLGRGYGKEELYQIGCIGLIKAIKRFDTSYEVKISTFAVPYIMGEIKRFLRDDGPIKISRSIKELSTKISEVQREYFLKNGKDIKVSDIAKTLNVSIEEVTEALDATRPVCSIDEELYNNGNSSNNEDKETKITKISNNQDDVGKLINRMTLTKLINELDEREQKIINLRYFREKTQTEVAKILRDFTGASIKNRKKDFNCDENKNDNIVECKKGE